MREVSIFGRQYDDVWGGNVLWYSAQVQEVCSILYYVLIFLALALGHTRGDQIRLHLKDSD